MLSTDAVVQWLGRQPCGSGGDEATVPVPTMINWVCNEALNQFCAKRRRFSLSDYFLRCGCSDSETEQQCGDAACSCCWSGLDSVIDAIIADGQCFETLQVLRRQGSSPSAASTESEISKLRRLTLEVTVTGRLLGWMSDSGASEEAQLEVEDSLDEVVESIQRCLARVFAADGRLNNSTNSRRSEIDRAVKAVCVVYGASVSRAAAVPTFVPDAITDFAGNDLVQALRHGTALHLGCGARPPQPEQPAARSEPQSNNKKLKPSNSETTDINSLDARQRKKEEMAALMKEVHEAKERSRAHTSPFASTPKYLLVKHQVPVSTAAPVRPRACSPPKRSTPADGSASTKAARYATQINSGASSALQQRSPNLLPQSHCSPSKRRKPRVVAHQKRALCPATPPRPVRSSQHQHAARGYHNETDLYAEDEATVPVTPQPMRVVPGTPSPSKPRQSQGSSAASSQHDVRRKRDRSPDRTGPVATDLFAALVFGDTSREL